MVNIAMSYSLVFQIWVSDGAADYEFHGGIGCGYENFEVKEW